MQKVLAWFKHLIKHLSFVVITLSSLQTHDTTILGVFVGWSRRA